MSLECLSVFICLLPAYDYSWDFHQRSWLSSGLFQQTGCASTSLHLHRCSPLKLIIGCGYKKLYLRPSVPEFQTILVNLKSSLRSSDIQSICAFLGDKLIFFSVLLPRFLSLQLCCDQFSSSSVNLGLPSMSDRLQVPSSSMILYPCMSGHCSRFQPSPNLLELSRNSCTPRRLVVFPLVFKQ